MQDPSEANHKGVESTCKSQLVWAAERKGMRQLSIDALLGKH